MTHNMPIGELLAQIDNDYKASIMSVRQLMASNVYSSTDKRFIAMKITQLVEQIKTEVLPWIK